jgi:LacI family transcriptional regulator
MNESPLAARLVAAGVRVVIVPVGPRQANACYILCDNESAAVLAADHLASQGLRHFAFAGFAEAVWSTQRGTAFCRRLAERGLTAQMHLVPLAPVGRRKQHHHQAIVRWLAQLPKPVGILACNDEFARSLAELCRSHNLRVPDEVALMGIDNDELICDLCNPPLSSVPFATEQAGYQTAELLDRLIRQRSLRPADMRVPACPVVVRQSTDRLAIDDPEVVKALRFIRDNAGRIIQVRDVVRATFLSHRTLHNRFCRAVGHSLAKEINQQRALQIARLLVGTQETLGHIARSLGYDNDAHMARYFRREMGETPRSYRRRLAGTSETL